MCILELLLFNTLLNLKDTYYIHTLYAVASLKLLLRGANPKFAAPLCHRYHQQQHESCRSPKMKEKKVPCEEVGMRRGGINAYVIVYLLPLKLVTRLG